MTDVQSTTPQPTMFQKLYARFEGLVREAGKFGTIGLITFLIDTGVYNLLWGPLNTLVAGTISMAVAATCAFIGNRFWTWRDRARTDLRREYALYFLFNLVGLVIALSCLGISHYVFGFTSQLSDNIAKNGVGLVLGTLFRFWSYRQIVFRKRPDHTEATPGSPAVTERETAG
ncbi:GtrA family protein [Dactylosporangium sp. CA-052675]|uniref:GtrA family protein n=1 Tax=Dactylosporangium sp. CA-052675 TaxID=3239927 RepID=UPI003D91AA5B